MGTINAQEVGALGARTNSLQALASYIRKNWPLWLPSLIVIVLYLPTLSYDLVWDDSIYLRDLPNYRAGDLWLPALFQPFVLSPNYFRPLALLTLVAELRISGQPALFHATNVVLHSLNVFLVTLLAFHLRKPSTLLAPASYLSMAPVLGAGLVYGLHPALLEGVAFVSGRFDLLMTSFLLLALLADLTLRGRRNRSITVGLAFLAAALSKEMAIAFALALPAWHLATADRGKSWLARLREQGNSEVYSALAVTGLTYLGLRFVSLGYVINSGTANAIPAGSLIQHILLVGNSLSSYAKLTIWPFTTLTPIHYSELPVSTANPGSWGSLILGGLIVYGLARWVRSAPTSGWLGVGATLALLPVLNLLPLELGGGAFIAERFLVFPLALLALAIGIELHLPTTQGVGLEGLGRRLLWPLRAGWLIAAVAVLQLTLPNWRDDLTLWSWAVRKAPLSSTPYTNLALEHVEMGQFDTSRQLAQHALELDPDNADAWDNLGLAYFHLGEFGSAQEAFAKAVDLQPHNALFWSNLAGALREQDDLIAAERILLEQSLRLNPILPAAHLNLGLIYLRADRPDLASEHLVNAVRLLPSEQATEVQGLLDLTLDPTRWLRLGQLLLQDGEAEAAAQAFSRAEELGASATDVAVALSAGLIELKEWGTAEELLLENIERFPDEASLYNNLGIVARELGEIEAAREYFSKAIELAPDWELPKQNINALPDTP